MLERPRIARWALWGLALGGAACSQATWPERNPRIIADVAVDSVKLWPPGMEYAASGDSAVLRIVGLQRGYTCARILMLKAEITETGGDAVLMPRDSVELPADGGCPVDPGLDTVLRTALPLAPDTKLRLQPRAGRSTDSILLVEAEGFFDSILYVPSPTGVAISGRFVFRDSNATHPRRTVDSDSLQSCETLQGAAYVRRGDTLRVYFRRLELHPVRHRDLPPCAGPHADTVEAVPDRFGFPRNL